MPLVDLSGAFEPGLRRDVAVDAIRRACEAVGFLVITGHGVADGLAQRVDSYRDFGSWEGFASAGRYVMNM